MFRAGISMAEHGRPRCDKIERKVKEKDYNSLFPNAFVDSDGAFLDGNMPTAVGRRCFYRDHL